jgi:hypothetical protein
VRDDALAMPVSPDLQLQLLVLARPTAADRIRHGSLRLTAGLAVCAVLTLAWDAGLLLHL